LKPARVGLDSLPVLFLIIYHSVRRLEITTNPKLKTHEMKPLTYFTQSDRSIHLTQIFGDRLQTLCNTDKLMLVALLSLTLARHWIGDRHYSLTNAANDQPYSPSRPVLRALSILHEIPDPEMHELIQAIAAQVSTPVGGTAA
jgi:hypothetical protein